ncbi:hypothetical protein GQR58_015107 [Nymphon striatum]|nr:hypothetical protein GQR58_015107 [Nymphon striatum]
MAYVSNETASQLGGLLAMPKKYTQHCRNMLEKAIFPDRINQHNLAMLQKNEIVRHDQRDNRGYYSKRHRGTNFKKGKGKSFIIPIHYITSLQGCVTMPSDKSYRFQDYPVNRKYRINNEINNDIEMAVDGHSSNYGGRQLVFHGKKVEKTFLLKTLTEFSDTPFVPISENNAVFYIEDWKTGTALGKFSHRITAPDVRIGLSLFGFYGSSACMDIGQLGPHSVQQVDPHLRPCIIHTEYSFLTDELECPCINVIMSKRYDDLQKKLDLSKFQADKGNELGYFSSGIRIREVIGPVMSGFRDNRGQRSRKASWFFKETVPADSHESPVGCLDGMLGVSAGGHGNRSLRLGVELHEHGILCSFQNLCLVLRGELLHCRPTLANRCHGLCGYLRLCSLCSRRSCPTKKWFVLRYLQF